MAISPYAQQICGTNTLWSAPNGATDLPTTSLPGAKVGDYVLNLSSTGPAMWRVTALSPLTFTSQQDMALVRTVSAATTISPQDGILIEQVATTITLPAATAFPVGQVVSIKNNSGGSVTVTPASGNIDAAASNTLTNLSHIAVATDGTNYFIVG